jgi:hypothetical protein
MIPESGRSTHTRRLVDCVSTGALASREHSEREASGDEACVSVMIK